MYVHSSSARDTVFVIILILLILATMEPDWDKLNSSIPVVLPYRECNISVLVQGRSGYDNQDAIRCARLLSLVIPTTNVTVVRYKVSFKAKQKYDSYI